MKPDVKHIWKRAGKGLGFYKNSPYVSEYLRDADVQGAVFIASVVVMTEIGMIIRYILRWVIPGKCETIQDFFYYTRSYWLLLGVTLLLVGYCMWYLHGHSPTIKKFSSLAVLAYFVFVMYFAVTTSLNDFSKGRMITCFLAMIMYISFMLIWRPFLSIALICGCGWGFLYILDRFAIDRAGNPVEMSAGDVTNFITFLAALCAVAVSVYHQRYTNAVKSEQLMITSVTDDLTGLPNMRAFTTEAAKYVRACEAKGIPLVYLVFNVENFKTYNERFGYEGGDGLLCTVGQIVARSYPQEPHARQDNDYFAVLTRAEGYEEKVNEVRRAFLAHYHDEVYLNMRVGAYRPPKADLEPRYALDRARYAGTLIKNDEEVFIREYDSTLGEKRQLRQYILNSLDPAIKNGYIKVYYQPVVWSHDGTLCGCEALARWDDPEKGFLSPGQFIPILEDCRQIHRLDRFIYEAVCQRIRDCLDKGLPVVPISLNFSRLDFELMDTVGVLENLVEKYQVPRQYLHVEITESALTSDEAGFQRCMDAFREKGYSIWLDDFGSGYSSLNVLKDFHFDLLKIDMVFLKNFSGNENAHKIVRKVLDLAKSLNMKTLTEGVETEEAVSFLKDSGCDRLQGYYYGMPMSYEELLHKVDTHEFRMSDHLLD